MKQKNAHGRKYTAISSLCSRTSTVGKVGTHVTGTRFSLVSSGITGCFSTASSWSSAEHYGHSRLI